MDLIVEGVSVKLGYWTWVNIVGRETIFSFIPASNFAGWLGVVFGFVVCYEYLGKSWKWLSAGLGYFVFVGMGIVFITISKVLRLPDNNYITLGIIFLIFIFSFLVVYHRNKILRGEKKSLG